MTAVVETLPYMTIVVEKLLYNHCTMVEKLQYMTAVVKKLLYSHCCFWMQCEGRKHEIKQWQSDLTFCWKYKVEHCTQKKTLDAGEKLEDFETHFRIK
jgi:hypothetical protein